MTILATSVFEKMCVTDPLVRFQLRPCGRRLVSADSSLLTVCWELDMNIDYDTGGGKYWFRRSAGNEGFAVVFVPPAGYKDRTIVGGRPVDAAVASTETGFPCGRSPNLFGSTAPE